MTRRGTALDFALAPIDSFLDGMWAHARADFDGDRAEAAAVLRELGGLQAKALAAAAAAASRKKPKSARKTS